MKADSTLSDGDRAATGADGKTKVALKGTKAGAHIMTTSMVGGKSKQLVMNFTVGTPTVQVNPDVTKDNSIVSSIRMTELRAIVTDRNGNLVRGIRVNFHGTSVTLSSTSVETDDQVFVEILVTDTEAGLKTVSASLVDRPTEIISRSLNAKVDVNSATTASQEVPESQVMVIQDIVVEAHVNDQFGNPVTHRPAMFSTAPSSQMTISQSTISTSTQGITGVTMTPERNGSYTVKASPANGASLEKQLEAIDEKLALTSSLLIGVNTPKGTALTAVLTSANGTPVEGQVISFSVTLEGATLSGGEVRTNSSGQALVVLTSNKVGTYTVTTLFYNGVIVQTQTTVKVTDNPSTAHVASFVVDPSAIITTNSDLSTLKAAIEDGSDDLIEGPTVYFVLKSGPTTLTPLAAMTDQNGIAITSVRGEITGSVTIGTVASAGRMQAVGISLVAGPADAPQSILKSNQSSLKGGSIDSAELHLVLYDTSGNSIKVS